MLCACGEPVLRNAPKPNPAAVAGVAAATAAAITLASPQTAAANQEKKNQGEPNDRPVEVKQTVPSDVLDRLDEAPSEPGPANDAGVDGGAAAAPSRGSAAPARAPLPTLPPPERALTPTP